MKHERQGLTLAILIAWNILLNIEDATYKMQYLHNTQMSYIPMYDSMSNKPLKKRFTLNI